MTTAHDIRDIIKDVTGTYVSTDLFNKPLMDVGLDDIDVIQIATELQSIYQHNPRTKIKLSSAISVNDLVKYVRD